MIVKELKLVNNNSIMELYFHERKIKNIFIVKNINKYSINCIFNLYFNRNSIIIANSQITNKNTNDYSEYKNIVNEYKNEMFLKFDSKEDLYINKMWKFFESRLITIFTSKAMKDAFNKIFEYFNFDKYIIF